MAFKFSQRSLKNLEQCDPRLQKIAHELIKEMDVVVICGHRGEKEQNDAVKRGTSKLAWPKSKHNKVPSLAFDAVPLVAGKINWEARAEFVKMREKMRVIADRLGIKVRFISWDLPHIELL